MKTVIISPTYNESENIKTLIDEVFKRNPDYHMLIVDDSSPDNTGDVVEQYCAVSCALETPHTGARPQTRDWSKLHKIFKLRKF